MTEDIPPKVSICIPTFNRAEKLDKALKSAINQDYPNIEIIVLDNASTDHTQTIVKNIQTNDNRVYYYVNPKNIGATNNFNKVVQLAKTEYYMWLADDDWMEPNYISVCMQELIKDSQLALVSSLNQLHYENAITKPGQIINLTYSNKLFRVLAYYAQVGDNGIFYGVYRKSLIKNIKIIDQFSGDWTYIASVAYLGKLKTVKGSMLHRCGEGPSSNLRKLAKLFGHSGLFYYEPYFTSALCIFKSICSETAVYAQSGRLKQYSLGVFVFTGIVLKKIILRRTYRSVKYLLKLLYKSLYKIINFTIKL